MITPFVALLLVSFVRITVQMVAVSCVVPMILLFAVANLADVVVLVTLVARQKIAVALFLDSLSRKRISCQAT